MLRKPVSGILLFLLLVSTLTLAFNIQPVKASGTIYIRADGSVDPPTAPIQRDGDIYTFTDNVYDSIVVEKDNIVVDGAGYTLQGDVLSPSFNWIYGTIGFRLDGIDGVTIKRTNIKRWDMGIRLYQSSSINIYENIMVNVYTGAFLYQSPFNAIVSNTVTDAGYFGIELIESSNNEICDNDIQNCTYMVGGINAANGIFLQDSCNNNIISGNNLSSNGKGLTIQGDSHNNIVFGNHIENNEEAGVDVSETSTYNNKFYHNSFIQNNRLNDYKWQVDINHRENVWDDGYPSGGNYWSDYTDFDQYSGPNQDQPGSDGIWDHPYVIDENNQDRYPLANPWLMLTDDFSTDSGMWRFVESVVNIDTGVEYPGSAYRDPANEYMVLTENRDYQAGVIWLNHDIFSPFTVEFKYKAGGGTGADGLVFMFYKQKNYDPYDGGGLGFVTPPGGPSSPTAVSGYGIEFDNFNNGFNGGLGQFEDPSGNHIAMIKDSVNNQLIYKDDQRTEANQSHGVKIVISNSTVEVYVDNESVLTWEGTIDRTYGGLGFSAATASHNNWHIIDDVKITVNPWTPTPPAKFKIGDWVQTTANLNVREDPGLSYTIIDTMPLGTTGQIVGGPVEADGFVWWDVDYALGVRGWSAENWLELYPVLDQPPTCVIKLQKDGVEIDKVGVWEFFDIYVGGSTGVKGIKQVRFSNDDVREGYPTGEWTEWYDWDVSSGDWDTATKIKRWAFATPGYKEVWAEVKDEEGYTAVGFATIFVPAPALPVLTSQLIITPVKDIYNVGDSLEAEFTIKNIGDVPITLDILTVGGRLNGWFVVDFTHQSVTLQPEESYQYQGTLTLTQRGNYRFFVAYHIENPTPNEKRLLDENNWNTCVELGEGLTHNDRVKNIIVFEEDIVPEDVIQLRNLIDRLKGLDTHIPPYLLDDKSFGGSVATLWMYWKSFFTDAWETYDMHYFAGLDYEYLRIKSLILAGDSLDRGDIESARKLVQMSIEFGELSVKSFQGAFEVYDRNIEQVESIARFVKDRSQTLAKGIVTVVFNPTAGKALDYFFLITDYLINRELVGVEEAKKIAIRDGVIKFLYNEWAFFDDMTLSEAVKVKPPFKLLTLQDYIKSSKTLPDELYDVIVLWIYGDVARSLSKKIADLLSGGIDYLQGKEFSPVELRAYNSQGKIVGVVDGEVRHEIPRSMYYNGTVTIFFPSDTYRFKVAGTDEGTYSLEITSVEAGNVTVFTATDISTSPNATHQYIIDWAALSQGEEGVTVEVDSDGDGLFEKTLTSNSELTYKEFMFPMRAIFTFDAFWEGVNYPVALSSSNSTITNFIFNQPSKQISFQVSGETGNSGYCNVTIPKTLLRGEPWKVKVNGTDWSFILSDNETHSFLYFNYTHSSTYEVTIQGTWAVPEFPSAIVLPLFMLTTLIATILLKKKRKTEPQLP